MLRKLHYNVMFLSLHSSAASDRPPAARCALRSNANWLIGEGNVSLTRENTVSCCDASGKSPCSVILDRPFYYQLFDISSIQNRKSTSQIFLKSKAAVPQSAR